MPSVKSILVAFLLLPLISAAEEITVFAAASLTQVLQEAGEIYGRNTGDTVVFNFAGSNTLARQIEAGAPADVFLSADTRQMDRLALKKLIVEETRKSLLGNTLVVVTSPDGPAIEAAGDLAGGAVRRLALGNPQAVPAGVYAKAWLESQHLWAALSSKVVPGENVRAALGFVESGNAEAGIVYKTDAAISDKVKVALEIPADEGPEIVYPVALLSDSRHAESARRFLKWLEGGAARVTFEKFGFTVLAE
ncbi:molybdate ABC transporter substrate-binding protein [Haloferula sargassicola]|uniref:Molybdate-binding protein ModA n=1 Tax=Haloferula sargassicola TaxID=490096 RepID=A0ABP9UR91_9BACT